MAQSIVFKLEIEQIQKALIKTKNTFGGELFEAPEDTTKFAAYNGRENIDLVIKTTSFKSKNTSDIELESETLNSNELSDIARRLFNVDSSNIRTIHDF